MAEQPYSEGETCTTIQLGLNTYKIHGDRLLSDKEPFILYDKMMAQKIKAPPQWTKEETDLLQYFIVNYAE